MNQLHVFGVYGVLFIVICYAWALTDRPRTYLARYKRQRKHYLRTTRQRQQAVHQLLDDL
jgi:hypothetical protein